MDDSIQFGVGIQILVGLVLLVLGRRLFWVFVGAIGFFLGMQFGVVLFGEMADWLRVLLSLVAGVVGAVLTILLQRLAVLIAGAMAGGMLAMKIAPMVGLYTEAGQLMAFVAGAAIVGVLLSALFDPALLVLSALMGAVMIADGMTLVPPVEMLVVVVLFAIGIAVQLKLDGSPRARGRQAG